eukprot:2222138-Rhodomonas_salina.6
MFTARTIPDPISSENQYTRTHSHVVNPRQGQDTDPSITVQMTQKEMEMSVNQSEMKCVPLAILVYAYIGISLMAVAILPIFVNHGTLTPYYIIQCLSPLILVVFIVNMGIAYLSGYRVGVICGLIGLTVCIPLLLATMFDMHTQFMQRRWFVYAAMIPVQLFYITTLHNNKYTISLVSIATLTFCICFVEIYNSDGTSTSADVLASAGVLSLQLACISGVALYNASQYWTQYFYFMVR